MARAGRVAVAVALTSCSVLGCGSDDDDATTVSTAPPTVSATPPAPPPSTPPTAPPTLITTESTESTEPPPEPTEPPATTAMAATTDAPAEAASDPAAPPPPVPGGQFWSFDFDDADGTSLTPPFQVSTYDGSGLVARDGIAYPETLGLAGYLIGEPNDPTNCFAQVTFNLAQGGNYGPVINHDGPATRDQGNTRSGYFLGWYQGDEAIRLYAAERPDPIATWVYGSRPDKDVTLRLERRGDDLEVFVDGESVMTAKASDQPDAGDGTYVGMVYRGTENYEQIGFFTAFAAGDL